MNAQQQKIIITEAADRYGISPKVLWGLYGTETSFGRDQSTSSAGAVGPFQFLPGTAKSLGVNPYDFSSAAYGAAKYLSQYKGRGVGGMLSAYNAGPAGGYQDGYVKTTLKNAETYGKPPKGATLSKAGLESLNNIGMSPTMENITKTFHPNPAETIPTFNKQGFEEARQHAQRERETAGLFKGTEPGETLLKEILNRAGKAPNAQEFGGTRVVKAPGGTFTYAANSGPNNSLANAVPHGAKLNGFLAGNEPLEVKRKDQGQDIKTSPNGAIYAPGDGVVKMVNSNPGGFGNAYPIVHFNTGPLAGHDVYIGHTRAALPAGAHFKAGAVLSHTGNGSGPFVGNATGLPGWAEIGLWTPSGPPAFGKGGNEIAPLLGLR